MKNWPYLATCFITLAIGSSMAQTPIALSDEIQGLRVEVARVGDSVERVSQTLEALMKLQKTNLLLQRLVFEQRRIAPIESELRSARSNLEHYEQELARLVGYKKELESADGTGRSNAEMEDAIRNQMSQIDLEIELQSGQLDANRRRVQELENDLSRGRRSLLVLEEQLTLAWEEL